MGMFVQTRMRMYISASAVPTGTRVLSLSPFMFSFSIFFRVVCSAQRREHYYEGQRPLHIRCERCRGIGRAALDRARGHGVQA